MKKLLSFIAVFGAVFAPLSAQADPLTGFYKIALVEDDVEITSDGFVIDKETKGQSGRGRVYVNSNGKLRFSGWIESWDFDVDAGEHVRDRTSLLGVVNPVSGKIRLTRIGGVLVSDFPAEENFVLSLRIIKRNDVVVGLTGGGSSSGPDDCDVPCFSDDTYYFTGYKTRDLLE